VENGPPSAVTWLSLGCHAPPCRTSATESDLNGRVWTPQPVVKTAGRPSKTVRYRAVQFSCKNWSARDRASSSTNHRFGCHWLSPPRKMAGMDGNRTHPGRLSSAPQTVLKTAGLPSMDVHYGPLQFSGKHRWSVIVRQRPRMAAGLAVILAVGKHMPSAAAVF
jgi:hypothetical protein